MSVKNGLINNEQRKALSKVLEDKVADASSAIHTKNGIVENDVDKAIKAQLGIDILEDMIEAKEKELGILKRRLSKLSGNYGSIYSRYREKIINAFDLDGREVRKLRHELIAKIWTVESTGEALKVVSAIDDVVVKHEKNLDALKPKMLSKAREIKKPSIEEIDKELKKDGYRVD